MSDPSGRVRVEGLPLCATSVEVGTAERECVSGWPAPGFLRKDVRAWIEGRTEGEVVAAAFRLGRAVVVSGRVRDGGGRPVEGAVVEARDTEGSRRGIESARPGRRRATRTDAAGRWAFAGLSPGSWSFEAGTSFGLATDTAVGLREGEGPFELDFVLRRFASISGVAVAPDGEPLAHLVLSLDVAHRTTKADAEGRFSFDDVEPGAWVIVAEEAGYRGVDHNEASVFGEAAPGQAIRDVRFQGPRRGTVEGVVVDQDGRAVPGVAVSLTRHGDQHFVDRWVGPEMFWGWTSVSDAHGRFRCEGVPDGTYSIRPQQATSSVAIGPGARDVRLVWYTDRLPGAHTRPPELMARVADAEGRAVALASGSRREDRSTVHTGASFSVTGGVYRGRAWSDVRRAIIEVQQAFDASGRQVFLGKAASGDLTAGVEALVRLPAVHAIEGRVIGEGGQPVAGVPVGLTDVRGTRQDAFFGPWIDAVTDAQGRFVVPGVQADADPQATAVVAGPWLVKLADAGPAAKSVEVRLTRGAVVRGRVLGPDGAPRRGATIRFGARGSWREDLTGPDGTFVLLGLPDGEQEVGIEFGRESGLERVTRKVSGAAGPVEIRASRATARIEGDLEIDDDTIFVKVAFRLFAADGPGADDPAAKPIWENPRTSSSKRDRSFELGPVPPGRYRLVVEELEGPRRRAEVLVNAPSRGVHVVAGGPAGLDGTVTGDGAAGALVEVHWTADGSPRAAWTRADAQGRFSARVPQGIDLRVFARAGSRCGVVGPVRTGGADVGVALAEGRVIEGRVVLPDSAPASILVTATDAEGRIVFGAADATGRFRIEGLPEGRYRVAARGVLDEIIWSGSTPDVPAGSTTVEVRLEAAAR